MAIDTMRYICESATTALVFSAKVLEIFKIKGEAKVTHRAFFYCASLLLFLATQLALPAQAQKRLISQNDEAIEEQNVDKPAEKSTDQKRVGTKAASKYMEPSSSSGGDRDHYLALHVGMFIDSDTYSWGVDHNGRNIDHGDDPGKLNMGLTYRMGEWTSTMDLNLRVDFQTYDLGKDKPVKMTLMPLITFPDANSTFPLYFGAGAGVGVFFKQTSQESALSLDYQLIAGARLFDLIENTGFFLEFGLKNHLLLLSDGQFNGVFLATGAMFTF